MGLFGNDRKLAQTKYAGRESASEKAARKAAEKAGKPIPMGTLAAVYEGIRDTEEARKRRNPVTRALATRKAAKEIPNHWNR